nr:hypothetical protein [Tanacetum cinerariifolium]
MIDVNPLNSVPPFNVAENIKDLDDASLEKDVADEAEKVHKSSKATEFPSAKELKDFADCHWVVAYVTPPSWKQHLKEISLEKLCDIHDRAYMRHVVLDNILNNWTLKLISTLQKGRYSCNAIRKCEREKDKAYAELDKKCNDALQDLDKNPLVLDMRAEIETLQGQVDKLYGEYSWHEKMPGYRSSLKKEFDQAGDDLATASYPFIAEATADPYAFVKELLSKKPKSLYTKPAPSHSKPSSLKSIAMIRNLEPPGAIDSGPTMSIRHREKGHDKVIGVISCFGFLGMDE